MSSIYTIKDHMTPKRLEWLKELKSKGVSKRHHSPVGCQCMRLGWTEWALDPDGAIVGERLTRVGLERLKEALK